MKDIFLLNYMDQSDCHKDYLISDILKYYMNLSEKKSDFTHCLDNSIRMSSSSLNMFSTGTNSIPKIGYEKFENSVKKLQDFIQIFKPDLLGMVQGEIVFIDEFDSNLHDVYLCALLEYLRDYGKGQLCFTTHNVGPMDILKRHKKSIDFLSIDHKIYPWTTNGNYSPSRLYKSGMIEGSPFNVDSIDFIGVFDSLAEEG